MGAAKTGAQPVGKDSTHRKCWEHSGNGPESASENRELNLI